MSNSTIATNVSQTLSLRSTFFKPLFAVSSPVLPAIPFQDQRMHALQARVAASEQALAALEQTATEQMEGLTQQSSRALDRTQRQLSQAFSQLEQLHSFIKVMLKSGQRAAKRSLYIDLCEKMTTSHTSVNI